MNAVKVEVEVDDGSFDGAAAAAGAVDDDDGMVGGGCGGCGIDC